MLKAKIPGAAAYIPGLPPTYWGFRLHLRATVNVPEAAAYILGVVFVGLGLPSSALLFASASTSANIKS